MRRILDPALIAFAVALVGSLAVHLPMYGALGVLAAKILGQERADASARTNEAIELDFETFEPPPEEEPEEDVDDVPNQREPVEASVDARETREAEPEPPVALPVSPPEPEPEPEPETEEQPRPDPSQPEHAITQRSQDPDVEPPPDTQYVARENNRVEEETVARATNMVEDTDSASLGEPERAPESEEAPPGDAEENELAEARDVEGSDERQPTPEEARAREVAAAEHPPQPAQRRAPEAERGPRRDGESAEPRRRRASSTESSRPTPSAPMETVTISDGAGTFVVRRPRARATSEARAAAEADGPGAHRREREGRDEGGPSRRRPGPDLEIGFSQFQDIVGREQLEEERQAYLEQRRSRRRGSSHRERWEEFRAALENFTPHVRVGNQTALNARASPFAEYTAQVHRRLHVPFHRFLEGLPAAGPLADPSLQTKLEIVLESDGSVAEIGIVRASGVLVYDHGAYAAVMSGQPYPVAPDEIMSGDGRVYLRWTFKRAQPFCHVSHAERYILDNGPADGSGDDEDVDGDVDEDRPGGGAFIDPVPARVLPRPPRRDGDPRPSPRVTLPDQRAG